MEMSSEAMMDGANRRQNPTGTSEHSGASSTTSVDFLPPTSVPLSSSAALTGEQITPEPLPQGSYNILHEVSLLSGEVSQQSLSSYRGINSGHIAHFSSGKGEVASPMNQQQRHPPRRRSYRRDPSPRNREYDGGVRGAGAGDRYRRADFSRPPTSFPSAIQHLYHHHQQHFQQNHIPNEPNFGHMTVLFSSLLLFTTLALLAALDATDHCISGEWTDPAYYTDDSIQDDEDDEWNGGVQQQQQCQYTFRHVVTPVCVITMILSLYSTVMTLQHEANPEQFHGTGCCCGMTSVIPTSVTDAATAAAAASTSSSSLWNDNNVQESDAEKKSRLFMTEEQKLWRRLRVDLELCITILLSSFLSLVSWTYGTVILMLEPWNDEENTNNNNNNNNEGRVFSQYQSLAAVDATGRVGDNANLYYTSWISLAISVALVYQNCIETVRQFRRCRIAAAQTATITLGDKAASNDNDRQNNMMRAADFVKRWSSLSSASLASSWSSNSSSSFLHHEQRRRSTWYNSLYRLRARTGMWVAALCATLVVVASSARIWKNIIVPAREAMEAAAMDAGDEVGGNEETDEDYDDDGGYSCSIVRLFVNFGDVDDVDEATCARTKYSIFAGVVASVLSLCAVVSHSLVRRRAADVAEGEDKGEVEEGSEASSTVDVGVHPEGAEPYPTKRRRRRHHPSRAAIVPLHSEFFLSILLSILLGLNAICATGVGGPAESVGNLYYGSWMCFLLCARIAVGCLEEILNIDDEEEAEGANGSNKSEGESKPSGTAAARRESELSTMNAAVNKQEDIVVTCSSTKLDMDFPDRYAVPPSTFGETNRRDVLRDNSVRTPYTSLESASGCQTQPNKEDKTEKVRSSRLRRFGAIAVFSYICVASALDAAYNQPDEVTSAQRYVMICPAVISIVTTVAFLLCLTPRTYTFIANFNVGGPLSLLVFLTWVSDLIIIQQSDSSWAVSPIGEIKMANLYYFTWASVVTAGLQMKSFIMKRFDLKPEGIMIVVWVAVAKVCFVIFGASIHVWHNIHGTCKDAERGAIPSCLRTKFAIATGVIGMVISFIIAVSHALENLTQSSPIPVRVRLRIEAVVSAILIAFFAVAVAIITGIGGPGQSVGDLYYASWLAFLVSLWVGYTCYDQIRKEKTAEVNRENGIVLESIHSKLPEGNIPCDRSYTPYVSMRQ